MFFSLAQILQWLMAYKYAVLLPVVIVEWPIVTIIAWFLVAGGYMDIYIAYGIAVIGDIIGDAMYYSIGRFGRNGLNGKLGKITGITPEKFEKIRKAFILYNWKVLIFGKVNQAFGSIILMSSGLLKMPFREFIVINALLTLLKTGALIAVGILFGRAYEQINVYLYYYAWAALVVTIIGYFLFAPKIIRYIDNIEELHQ